MSYITGTVGRELNSVPFGAIISQIAIGIAEGQWALDKTSIRVAELMSGQQLLRDLDTGKLIDGDGRVIESGPPQVVDSRVFFGYDYIKEGDDAVATIGSDDINSDTGVIENINLVESGSEYDFAPDIEIIGDGSGATAVATVSNGEISAINIVDGGTGYTTAEVFISGGGARRVPRKVSMMELGFAPNFYQFIDTIIEIKIVVNMVTSSEQSKDETPRTVVARSVTQQKSANYYTLGTRNWWRGYTYRSAANYSRKRETSTVVTKTVDAAYSNKYNYSVEGSSLVRTKLVPIPPPTILEERIRAIIETEEKFRDATLRALGSGATDTD